MEDFGSLPGNSHSAKLRKEQQNAGETETSEATETTENETPKKVVSGKVVTKRKPLGVQLKEMFASEGDQSFLGYLIDDVAIPMIQETIVTVISSTLDGIKNGIEDRITGGRSENRTTRTTSYGTGKRVDYNAQYRASRPSVRSAAPAPRMTIRRSNRVVDIFLETREDGMDIIEELQGKIDGFGHCTVADLYSCIPDMEIKTTDEAWGWDDLNDARVRRLATGQFQLVVPRPIPIQFEN